MSGAPAPLYTDSSNLMLKKPVKPKIVKAAAGGAAAAPSAPVDISAYYEIAATAAFIVRNRATKIALQFGDAQLRDSSAVVHALTQALKSPNAYGDATAAAKPAAATTATAATPTTSSGGGGSAVATATAFDIFVLADSSYSACCVDEVAAAHASADLIVHFGYACLSPTNRLPVRYCFGRSPQFDVAHAAHAIRNAPELAGALRWPDGPGVVVFYDLEFEYAIPALRHALTAPATATATASTGTTAAAAAAPAATAVATVPTPIASANASASAAPPAAAIASAETAPAAKSSTAPAAAAATATPAATPINICVASVRREFTPRTLTANNAQPATAAAAAAAAAASTAVAGDHKSAAPSTHAVSALPSAASSNAANCVTGSCADGGSVSMSSTSTLAASIAITSAPAAAAAAASSTAAAAAPAPPITCGCGTIQFVSTIYSFCGYTYHSSYRVTKSGGGTAIAATSNSTAAAGSASAAAAVPFTIVYIGSEGPALTNLMLNFNAHPTYTYRPSSAFGSGSGVLLRREDATINRTLSRRYFLMEKAKNANIIGIVVGTLGVGNYLELINHLKARIRRAGKKYYMFVVGKINAPKLANFSEIDIFVLVACPLSSMLDSSAFFKDVVTPFELDLALDSDKKWTGAYSTDFHTVLSPSDANLKTSSDRTADDEAGVRYSSITRSIVPLHPTASTATAGAGAGSSTALVSVAGGGALVPVVGSTALTRVGGTTGRDGPSGATTASEYLLTKRTYTGLDLSAGGGSGAAGGPVPVATITKGWSGIARTYDEERNAKTDTAAAADAKSKQ